MSTFPGFSPDAPPAQLPASADPSGMSPQAKAMIAQALMMGGGGGGMGGPQNSFAGGVASGVNPMLQAMMRQRMMAQLMPGAAGAGMPPAPIAAPRPEVFSAPLPPVA